MKRIALCRYANSIFLSESIFLLQENEKKNIVYAAIPSSRNIVKQSIENVNASART